MTPKGFQPARSLPPKIKILATAVIGFHLLALGVAALAAGSRPWPVTSLGQSHALPPQFAFMLSQVTTQYYLEPLCLANDYHFASNQTMNPTITLEARLFDKNGNREKTLKFPDPEANTWVQNQQRMMTQILGPDPPFQPDPGLGVFIQPPGRKPQRITFWLMEGPRTVGLYQADRHVMRRIGPSLQVPSEGTLILVRSYYRFLKKQYPEAAKIELVRCSRDPVMPHLMFTSPRFPDKLIVDDAVPSLQFWQTLVSNLGNCEPKDWQPPKVDGDGDEGGGDEW